MKKINYKNIPNCLRKLRKVNGYSQKQVAMILGVRNTGMISRWEKGWRMPSPLNIFRLSILYNTMADALYIDLIRFMRKEIQEKKRNLE